MPAQFTCTAGNVLPPIEVSDPPAGTSSFAIIRDDPDAPKGTFRNWLAYDLPASKTELQVDAGKSLRNSFGRDGYGGRSSRDAHTWRRSADGRYERAR